MRSVGSLLLGVLVLGVLPQVFAGGSGSATATTTQTATATWTSSAGNATTPFMVAAPASATLYFHVLGMSDMPINKQEPPADWTTSTAEGLVTPTVNCSSVPSTPQQSLTGTNHQTYYGYLTPTLVEYRFTENGKPRVHPERGLVDDVRVNATAPWTLHWYLKVASPGAASDRQANQVPIIVPNVVVRATVRTGEAIGVGEQPYNTGDIVAQGQTAPITLAGPDTARLANATGSSSGFEGYAQGADGSQVYGFGFPLALQAHGRVLPEREGFNVRIDVFTGNPVCGDPTTQGNIMPNVVSVFSDAGHRPRMRFTIDNPMTVLSTGHRLAQDVDNRTVVVFAATVLDPWGTYDILIPSNVTVDGPVNGSAQSPFYVNRLAVHCHDCWRQPLFTTRIWDPSTSPAGQYTAQFPIQDSQASVALVAPASLQWGQVKPQPGPAVPLVLGLVAALAVARRP